METELVVIRGRVQTFGSPAAHIGTRIGETILGDLAQPWNRVKKYSTNAELSLSEMKVRAGHMSSKLHDMLEINKTYQPKITALQKAIADLREEPDASEEIIESLTRDAEALAASLNNHSRIVHDAVSGCSTFGGYINQCTERFEFIRANIAAFDPSVAVEVFLRIYDVLEFAGGIIAGGAAQDANILKGLDPINKEMGWVTASNFTAYVVNLDEAKTIVKNIRDSARSKK
jgi:hypothetical protein